MNDFEKDFTQARNYVDTKNFKDMLIMGDFISLLLSGQMAVLKR